MCNINYVHGLESALYKANQRIDELTTPYKLTVNGTTQTVKELKDIKKILEEYRDQAVTIEMKKARVKTKNDDKIIF